LKDNPSVGSSALSRRKDLLGKGAYTSSWRGDCRRDKSVIKVGITVTADTAALFLFSCSTALPNSYYK